MSAKIILQNYLVRNDLSIKERTLYNRKNREEVESK